MLTRPLALCAALLLLPLAGAARADDGRVTLHHPRRPAVRRAHHHAPARRHVHRSCRHVPGHHAHRLRTVRVPGHHVRTVKPARYSVRWDPHARRFVRVLVRRRRVVSTWVPTRYERRRVRVWVPGRWSCET